MLSSLAFHIPWLPLAGYIGGDTAASGGGMSASASVASDLADLAFGVSVVSADNVCDVVRMIAVNADIACQAMHDGQVRACMRVCLYRTCLYICELTCTVLAYATACMYVWLPKLRFACIYL